MSDGPAPPKQGRVELRLEAGAPFSAVPEAAAPAAGRPVARRAFWLVVLIALGARALHLAQASSAPLFDLLIMDGAAYVSWARGIAAGDWIGEEVFYQAPLYPYVLAVVQLVFGDGLWPIRILQALLGSLSCGLLFLAGQSFFSRRVGLGAGLVLALYPPAIFFDGLVQKASLGGVLMTLLLALLGRARRAPSPKVWLACGVALGALMATREETLLLAPVLLAGCALQARRQPGGAVARRIAALVAGLALALTPIAARNAFVGGEFVLTTAQAGPNFFIGNHEGASGVYVPLRPGRSSTPLERIDAKELAELGAGRPLSAKEVSNYWFEQAFTWIHSDPLAWLRLLARKLALALNAYEVPDYEDQQYYAEHARLLRWLGHVLHFGVLAPLAAAGIYLSWPRRRELALLLGMLAMLVAGCVLFYVFGRYRYPIAPIAILFAAAGVAHAHEAWLERRTRPLAVAGALALLLAFVSNWPLIEARPQLAMSYSNAGAALFDAGRDAQALVQLRRSLELDDDPDTRANLAAALVRLEQGPEALVHARRALELRPGDPILLRVLANALYATGDEPGAIEAYKASIQAWPQDPASWGALVRVFVARDDWRRAVETATNALRYNPADVSTALTLAWVLATSPDETVRDPENALKIVAELEKRTSGADLRVLDVYGVALSSAGRHEEAQDKFERAAQLAEAAGQHDLANRMRVGAAALREQQDR